MREIIIYNSIWHKILSEFLQAYRTKNVFKTNNAHKIIFDISHNSFFDQLRFISTHWFMQTLLESGMWKRLYFCGSRSGSTLKKEVGSRSKLGSIWFFEELEAEALYRKTGARDVEAKAVKAVKFLWKRKHFTFI